MNFTNNKKFFTILSENILFMKNMYVKRITIILIYNNINFLRIYVYKCVVFVWIYVIDCFLIKLLLKLFLVTNFILLSFFLYVHSFPIILQANNEKTHFQSHYVLFRLPLNLIHLRNLMSCDELNLYQFDPQVYDYLKDLCGLLGVFLFVLVPLSSVFAI